MRLLVMGLGFVGLTTALGFADVGMDVAGFDINANHARNIKDGNIPFFEEGLSDALRRTQGKTFHIAETLEKIGDELDAVFICVGTPCNEDGRADLGYVKDALNSLARIKERCLIVVKSTVPPGTTTKEILPFVRSLDLGNTLAVNPEFLREGHCWQDFTCPDRIVCGVCGDGDEARNVLREIYAPFHAPIHFVTPSTAEFVKYLSNSLLAALISFSNEMAGIADAAGDIAIGEAFRILHEDSRMKGAGITHYIYPGCGYGGYCLPKDTVALVQNAAGNGYEPEILRDVINVNNSMSERTAKKIAAIAETASDSIGVLGLAFKPDSDDVRDAPAARIIKKLIEKGYDNIYAYDPQAMSNFEKSFSLPIHYCDSAKELCEKCRVVALVTAWGEFARINKKYPEVRWVDCRYFL